MSGSPTHHDVIVIGARCAGAATALLLARAGRRVLLVDRARRGSDTLSTHALMRGAVLQLHRWGVLETCTAATPPITSTAFHYGGDRVDVAIKARHGVGALFAPRRYVLDAALVDAAERAGAVVAFEHRVVDLVRTPTGRVAGVVVADTDDRTTRVESPLVVGADGVHSTVARLVAAPGYHEGTHAAGVVYGYWQGLDIASSHWGFAPGMSVGAIPTTDGATCVFATVNERRFADVFKPVPEGYRHVIEACAPWLAARLARGRLVSGLRGFGGTRGFFRQSHGAGWALVGDAGCFKDPITAHGITDALRDAELLASAALDDAPDAYAAYQERRDELARPVFDITDAIASFEWTLPELQGLHRALSEAMNREADAIATWDVGRFTAPALSVTA